MTWAGKAALLLLCTALLVVADDVTTLIYGARQKALEDMRSLNRCVCQETVNRYRFKAKLQQQKPIVGCAGTPADTPLSPGFDSSLVLKDRLRFDVSIAPNGEMFSWASASQFVSS